LGGSSELPPLVWWSEVHPTPASADLVLAKLLTLSCNSCRHLRMLDWDVGLEYGGTRSPCPVSHSRILRTTE